jgi:hypothetical protein
MAEVDADVVGSQPMCWLCRQVEAFLTRAVVGGRGDMAHSMHQALGVPRTALLHGQQW